MSGDPFRKLIDRMQATFAEHQWKALLRSYVLAMRDERKARLAAIIELSVELERIRKESIYGTAFHEQVIEAIIEGDWEEAARIDALLLKPGSIDAASDEGYRKLWENFRAIVLAACADAARRAAGLTPEPD